MDLRASSRERLVATLALAALPVGCLALYLNDPEQSALLPGCPFRSLTGLDCPGCGATRAAHQALRGNLAEAAGYNLLALLALPLAGYALASLASFALSGRRLPRLPLARWWGRGVGFALVAFFSARNLPFEPFSWLSSS